MQSKNDLKKLYKIQHKETKRWKTRKAKRMEDGLRRCGIYLFTIAETDKKYNGYGQAQSKKPSFYNI